VLQTTRYIAMECMESNSLAIMPVTLQCLDYRFIRIPARMSDNFTVTSVDPNLITTEGSFPALRRSLEREVRPSG
jgi:hypothetical protein